MSFGYRPLRHPRVCSLHIAINLQVIPRSLNDKKSNYFCPEQMDMFGDLAQLELHI